MKYPIDKYKWYHKIQIDADTWTPGDHRIDTNTHTIERMAEIDFKGKRVLDIGTRDGLHAFEAERRGAAHIHGIDTCLSLGAVEFLIPHFKSKVRMEERSVYEIEGPYDVIIFAGVLYHLKYPFVALSKIADALVDGGKLLIETAMWQNLQETALLYCPKRTESPYGNTSQTFFNYKGLVDNLGVFGLMCTNDDYYPKPREPKKEHSVNRYTLISTKCQDERNEKMMSYWNGHPHKNWQK